MGDGGQKDRNDDQRVQTIVHTCRHLVEIRIHLAGSRKVCPILPKNGTLRDAELSLVLHSQILKICPIALSFLCL
jgi:hypothetical protein